GDRAHPRPLRRGAAEAGRHQRGLKPAPRPRGPQPRASCFPGPGRVRTCGRLPTDAGAAGPDAAPRRRGAGPDSTGGVATRREARHINGYARGPATPTAGEPMSQAPHSGPTRAIDRYFASYSADHRHPLNQRIHVVAVPAILWSVVALVWCVPVFGTWTRTGIWAALAMFAAWSFYNRLSRRLGLGMLALFFFCGCVCRLIEMRLGPGVLLAAAAAVFVFAWVAQFVGHHYE